MTNPNFQLMMHSLSALDEPIRRKRPHKKPKQAKKWKRDRQAERQYLQHKLED